jgi:Glycosyl transferase family group 2
MQPRLGHRRGKFVVIYDAEDRPEPDQLRRCIEAFGTAPESIVCLQAKLNYFNRARNLLTRWFTAEYSVWFDQLFPGLQALDVAIPLGGTSKHFITAKLREIGGWNPYNVTEDADLGVRIFLRGWKTAILDSTTYEEATSRYHNWIRQRSRWVKGYMQTYLLHMRNPLNLYRRMGPRAFFAFQLFFGAGTLCLLLNPIYWLMTLLWFAAHVHLIQVAFPGPVFYAGIAGLILGNAACTLSAVSGCFARQHYEDVKWAFLVPLYWILMSAAILTRYEGWALLAVGVPVVALWSHQARAPRSAARANALVFATIGGYGIGLWLLYNLVIFGSPLYFLQSAYSAQAINGAQAQFGLLGTKGSILQSVLTYGWAVIEVCGPVVVLLSAAAAAALLGVRHWARRRSFATLVLLFAPAAFDVVSLYAGQITIRVPELPPHGMWNDRYALMALPLCAVVSGLLAARWRITAPLVAGAAAIAAVTMALGTPLLIADGRTGTSSATGGHPEVAAAYLHRHYRGGEVLADDSASSTFIFDSDLDLRQFITDGDHPYFDRALASPAANAAWVVATPGDAVTADIDAHPARFASFRKIITDGRVTLYERQPLDDAR